MLDYHHTRSINQCPVSNSMIVLAQGYSEGKETLVVRGAVDSYRLIVKIIQKIPENYTNKTSLVWGVSFQDQLKC